jgi:hypothetical protein
MKDEKPLRKAGNQEEKASGKIPAFLLSLEISLGQSLS